MSKQTCRITLLLALLLLLPACLHVSAHPGRTDAKGGHYDHSTGEYHYHHGYPAHQHENGVCPYDFDDKTGSSSGNSSFGSKSTPSPAVPYTDQTTGKDPSSASDDFPATSLPHVRSTAPDPLQSKSSAKKNGFGDVGIGFYLFVGFTGLAIIFCFVVFVVPLFIGILELIFVEPFRILYNKLFRKK